MTEPIVALAIENRRDFIKLAAAGLAAVGLPSLFAVPAQAQAMNQDASNFYTSDRVTVQKVEFNNQYRMKLVGNLFVPKTLDRNTKHAAIIVGHPFGATKEQSANLYATKMAEQGFVTLSFDLSYWGESEGQPRQVVAPDIYADGFSAAVDYLGSALAFIDRNRIGAIGVCASGGFVISAAKVDSRLKAIATVSMVDMGGAARFMQTLQQRKVTVAEAAAQRYVEAEGGATRYTGGTVHQLTADTPAMQREFYDFYRTPRGEFTPVSSTPELTTHPTLSSDVKFLNFYPLNDIDSIGPRPLLFIAGEQAVSKGMSEQAYQMAAEPKELFIVSKAGHVDLYDRVSLIPFDKLNAFFSQHLI